MEELAVTLNGENEVELQTVDIEISGETIAFSVEGLIRGVDAHRLEAVAGGSLEPSEIRFTVAQ